MRGMCVALCGVKAHRSERGGGGWEAEREREQHGDTGMERVSRGGCTKEQECQRGYGCVLR